MKHIKSFEKSKPGAGDYVLCELGKIIKLSTDSVSHFSIKEGD